MTSETKTVDIPARALVHCPMHRFALRRVQKCETCKSFGGLNERMSGDAVPFEGAYQVVCVYPIARAISMEAED